MKWLLILATSTAPAAWACVSLTSTKSNAVIKSVTADGFEIHYSKQSFDNQTDEAVSPVTTTKFLDHEGYMTFLLIAEEIEKNGETPSARIAMHDALKFYANYIRDTDKFSIKESKYIELLGIIDGLRTGEASVRKTELAFKKFHGEQTVLAEHHVYKRTDGSGEVRTYDIFPPVARGIACGGVAMESLKGLELFAPREPIVQQNGRKQNVGGALFLTAPQTAN